MSNIYTEIGYLKLQRMIFPVIDRKKAKEFLLQLGWVDVHNDCVRQPGIPFQLNLVEREETKGIEITFSFSNPNQAAKTILEWIKAKNWKYNIIYTLTGVEIELPEVFSSNIKIEKDIGLN